MPSALVQGQFQLTYQFLVDSPPNATQTFTFELDPEVTGDSIVVGEASIDALRFAQTIAVANQVLTADLPTDGVDGDLYYTTDTNILYVVYNGSNYPIGGGAVVPRRPLALMAVGGWPSTTNGCTGPTKTESTTNKVNYYSLDFADTSKLYAEWSLVMPASYSGGTLKAKFVWTANSASNSRVVWGIACRAYGDDDALDAAQGTAVEVSDNHSATAYMVNITAESDPITPGGTPAGGKLLQVRVYRDPTNSLDVLAATANLLAVYLTYPVSTFTE